MRVLITGENGYLSKNVKNYLENWQNDFQVSTISLRDGNWKSMDLSLYDAILHFASIVHVRETNSNKEDYKNININLTRELAIKAKERRRSAFYFYEYDVCIWVGRLYTERSCDKTGYSMQPKNFIWQNKISSRKYAYGNAVGKFYHIHYTSANNIWARLPRQLCTAKKIGFEIQCLS